MLQWVDRLIRRPTCSLHHMGHNTTFSCATLCDLCPMSVYDALSPSRPSHLHTDLDGCAGLHLRILDREHVRQKRAFLLAWRECVERRAFLDSSFEACCDLRRAYAQKLWWCAWRTAAEAARKKEERLEAACTSSACVRVRGFLRLWQARHQAAVRVERMRLGGARELFKTWRQRADEGRSRRILLRRIHDMWGGRNVWQALHLWRDGAHARTTLKKFALRHAQRHRVHWWCMWRKGVAACAEKTRGRHALATSLVRVLRTAKCWQGARVYVRVAKRLLRTCLCKLARMVSRGRLRRQVVVSARRLCCCAAIRRWRANSYMSRLLAGLMRKSLMQWIRHALRCAIHG
jgi:hypothetical protein